MSTGCTARRRERITQGRPVVRPEDVRRAGVLTLRIVARRTDDDAAGWEKGQGRTEPISSGARPARLDERREQLAIVPVAGLPEEAEDEDCTGGGTARLVGRRADHEPVGGRRQRRAELLRRPEIRRPSQRLRQLVDRRRAGGQEGGGRSRGRRAGRGGDGRGRGDRRLLQQHRVVAGRVVAEVVDLDGVHAGRRQRPVARVGAVDDALVAAADHGSGRIEELPDGIEGGIARRAGRETDRDHLARGTREREGVGLAEAVDGAADQLAAIDQLGAVGLAALVDPRARGSRRRRTVELAVGGRRDRFERDVVRARRVVIVVPDGERERVAGGQRKRLALMLGGGTTGVVVRQRHAVAVGVGDLPLRVELERLPRLRGDRDADDLALLRGEGEIVLDAAVVDGAGERLPAADVVRAREPGQEKNKEREHSNRPEMATHDDESLGRAREATLSRLREKGLLRLDELASRYPPRHLSLASARSATGDAPRPSSVSPSLFATLTGWGGIGQCPRGT